MHHCPTNGERRGEPRVCEGRRPVLVDIYYAIGPETFSLLEFVTAKRFTDWGLGLQGHT